MNIKHLLLFCVLLPLGMHAMAASSSSSSSQSSVREPTLTSGFVYCARTGETCSFSGTRTVMMDSCFEWTCMTTKRVATGSVQCSGWASGAYGLCGYSSTTEAEYVSSLVATASNQSGSSKSAGMAVDGNTATRWEASNTSTGTWLRVDLPKALTVRGVELVEYGNRIQGYAIEYLSGSGWITAINSAGPLGTASYNMSLPSVTALRLRITTKPTGQPSIAEFRVKTGTDAPVETVQVGTPIVVAAGQSFDGAGKTYVATGSVLRNGDTAGQPMFVLEQNASIRNLTIAAPSPVDTLVVAKGGNFIGGVHWRTLLGSGVPLAATGNTAIPVQLNWSHIDGTRGPAVVASDNAAVYATSSIITGTNGFIDHQAAGAGGINVYIYRTFVSSSAYIVRSPSAATSVRMSLSNYCYITAPSLFILNAGVTPQLYGNTTCAM